MPSNDADELFQTPAHWHSDAVFAMSMRMTICGQPSNRSFASTGKQTAVWSAVSAVPGVLVYVIIEPIYWR